MERNSFMKAKGLILAFLACSLIFAGFSAEANETVNVRVLNDTSYAFYVKENNIAESTVKSGYIYPDSTWVGPPDTQWERFFGNDWDGFLCFLWKGNDTNVSNELHLTTDPGGGENILIFGRYNEDDMLMQVDPAVLNKIIEVPGAYSLPTSLPQANHNFRIGMWVTGQTKATEGRLYHMDVDMIISPT